jgi:hypothetical protein
VADERTYWAARELPEFLNCAWERIEKYREFRKTSGLAYRQRKAMEAYLGVDRESDNDSASIVEFGEQGELLKTKVNQVRSLVQQTLSLTTSQKPAAQAIARNSDYRSLTQTVLANGLIEFYLDQEDADAHLYAATELAIVQSEGFVTVEWDANAGDAVAADPEAGQEVMGGDLSFGSLGPAEVIRDPGVKNFRHLDWLITETRANKWELAAQYPELAEKIYCLKREEQQDFDTLSAGTGTEVQSDQIALFKFFHRPNKALPGGRLVTFVSKDIGLIDTPLPYEEIPVYRIAPGNIPGTPFAYTSVFDLQGLQQGLDSLFSMVLSNADKYGLQNVLFPDNANASRKDIGGGMNVISVNEKVIDKIRELNLFTPQTALVDLARFAISQMEQISGSNPAMRGTPEHEMSGSMAALMVTRGIEFTQGLQKSYAGLFRSVATGIVRRLKKFADSKRVAVIAGKANQFAMKEFSSEDISDVERVSVEMANPLLRTQAGRVQQLELILSKGVTLKPQEILTFINTGKLEPVFEGEQANLLRIRKNKELLQQGIGLPPQVPAIGPDGAPVMQFAGNPSAEYVNPLVIDTHWLDIPEYASVLAMPGARSKPEVVNAVLGVINLQLQMWRNMDPALLALLGGPPPPPAGMTAEMLAGAPPPPPSGGQGPGAPPPSGALAPKNEKAPQMPALPKNPQTGDRFQPPAGDATA